MWKERWTLTGCKTWRSDSVHMCSQRHQSRKVSQEKQKPKKSLLNNVQLLVNFFKAWSWQHSQERRTNFSLNIHNRDVSLYRRITTSFKERLRWQQLTKCSSLHHSSVTSSYCMFFTCISQNKSYKWNKCRELNRNMFCRLGIVLSLLRMKLWFALKH